MNKIFQTLILVILVVFGIYLFPLERMQSAEFDDNPNHCPYYFTLQAYLAVYPGLASDTANSRFIQSKLQKFENAVARSNHPEIAQQYRQSYLTILKNSGLNNITQASQSQIIMIASMVAPIVDAFYLDNRLFCYNPLYDWEPRKSRRILRYNLNGLFDQIPNKYTRILSAISDDWLAGSSPGLFFNNQTTTLDTRFMTGLPLLTALYVQPKCNYMDLGGYVATMPWSYFRSAHMLDPITRKVLDVGGIDVFTFKKAELGNKIIPGTTPLATNIPEIFGSWLVSLINEQSYGMAYIANNILTIDPQFVKDREKIVKRYFSRHKYPEQFTRNVNDLYAILLQLKNKYDIVLETTHNGKKDGGKGNVQIKGIVGKRALFEVDCLTKNCFFVYNLAYAPGWHVLVNGNDALQMRANFAFMGVPLKQGKSFVWFIYESFPGLLSYFISILTLLSLFILVVLRIEKE